MVTKRRVHEKGHQRKFLVILDGSPESDRALSYAAHRVLHAGGQMVLLAVIEPGEFTHWLGVEDVMRAEAHAEAEEYLATYATRAKEINGLEPETAIREGKINQQIGEIIEEDADIAILVLAASLDKDGPGPLITAIVSRDPETFSIPVVLVPGDISDDDIDALT